MRSLGDRGDSRSRRRWGVVAEVAMLVVTAGVAATVPAGASVAAPRVLTRPTTGFVASLNANPGSGPGPLTVSFDASGSTDTTGTITSWTVAFGDGNSASGTGVPDSPTTSHTYDAVGIYTATVTLTDSTGATATATATVTVNDPITPAMSVTEETTSFTDSFDASASTDATGTIMSWSINFGDGTSTSGTGAPTSPTASHTYPGLGTYTAILSLTDSNGYSSQLEQTVHSDEQGYDWTQYDGSNKGGSQTFDPVINATNASELALRPGWPLVENDPSMTAPLISTQPLVANGMVYWGDWNGYEHATPVDGGPGGWSVPLGTTTYPRSNACSDRPQGVVAAGTIVDNITVNGQVYPSVIFVPGGGNDAVGGGYQRVCAINALTGGILWAADVEPAPNFFLYASPLVYKPPGQSAPSVYEAISRRGDSCGAAHGGLIKLDTDTGDVQATWNDVPAGCNGASIWGTPSIDRWTNSIFVTTGNGAPGCKTDEEYGFSIVKLNASTLSPEGYWQLPKADRKGSDDDFGTLPLLFTGTVTPGGPKLQLLGAINKNGNYYVFKRNDLAAGPIWQQRISGHDGGAIAPAGFNGSTIFIGGPAGKINGVSYPGVLWAFNVDNLNSPLWTIRLPGQDITSVTVGDGVVAVSAGTDLVVVNQATGQKIISLHEVGAKYGGSPEELYCAPTIANGVLYDGGNGYLYAYTVGGV